MFGQDNGIACDLLCLVGSLKILSNEVFFGGGTRVISERPDLACRAFQKFKDGIGTLILDWHHIISNRHAYSCSALNSWSLGALQAILGLSEIAKSTTDMGFGLAGYLALDHVKTFGSNHSNIRQYV